MTTLIEVGHFYAAKGPTAWSQTGLAVMAKVMAAQAEFKTMLFVDDVHGPPCVPPPETALPALTSLDFQFDFLIKESEVKVQALEVLEVLKNLPGKKKARSKNGVNFHFKDFALTTPLGQPACVLYDAGLSLYKSRLGFQSLINILPVHYAEEQRDLLRLLRTGLPGINQRVILFTADGAWEELLLV